MKAINWASQRAPADIGDTSPGVQPVNSQQAQKRSKFYFDDSLVVIQVEDMHFKVHRSQLLKSETFRDMFSIGDVIPVSGEGSDNNPIKLSGVRADDFEKLLTMLYTFHYSNDKPAEDASLLMPALRLANMWNFNELRALLVPLAEKTLDDVDKIVYAREFGAKEWLAPAHVQLCMRDAPLTKEEAAKVGLDSLLIISHLREKALLTHTQPQNGSCGCASCRKKSGVSQGTYTANASYFEQPIKAWIDSNFERLGL
ncbi:hypothetical protein FRC08_007489 [Ceratobasidium sp. 394]|nr:hypothetical protein FRC08_007489 [Ceratobasidium sp. 394]